MNNYIYLNDWCLKVSIAATVEPVMENFISKHLIGGVWVWIFGPNEFGPLNENTRYVQLNSDFEQFAEGRSLLSALFSDAIIFVNIIRRQIICFLYNLHKETF